MIRTLSERLLSDAEWVGLVARRPRADFYAIISTGIVCRHGCAARTPLRKNVRLFDSVEAAIHAGYRPCKRCQPNTDHPVSRTNASTAAVPNLELP